MQPGKKRTLLSHYRPDCHCHCHYVFRLFFYKRKIVHGCSEATYIPWPPQYHTHILTHTSYYIFTHITLHNTINGLLNYITVVCTLLCICYAFVMMDHKASIKAGSCCRSGSMISGTAGGSLAATPSWVALGPPSLSESAGLHCNCLDPGPSAEVPVLFPNLARAWLIVE